MAPYRSEMVQRVARAIERSIVFNPKAEDFEFMALAVIAAMREPTEAMVAAAEAPGHWYDCEENPRSPAEAWRGMIHAALVEDASAP